MKRSIFYILLILPILICTSIVASASNDEPFLIVYNTQLTTRDLDATYIEGEVAIANGQELILKHGLSEIAKKTLPNTGESATFRIKVPSNSIHKQRINVYYLNCLNSKEGIDVTERVEVRFKERESQKINISKSNYSLTIPGNNDKLIAKASSNNDLIYISKNPDVVKVEKDGTIVAVSDGKAEISIQQVGNGRYSKAEKTVGISVETIDAYSVTFHSSDDENNKSMQIVNTNEETYLNENIFENGDHSFLGWATEDGGFVEYKDAEAVVDLCEKGENKDLYAVWTGDGAAAALAWAIDIANDDSFAYGTGDACHSVGCYFCGTNQIKKPKGYEKTYVCLTFVGAAYAHGAEDPELLAAERNAKLSMYENNDNFTRFSCWTKLGSCNSLSISDLEPGDVIIKYDENNGTGHVAMYAGGDNMVDASDEGWGPGTISLHSGASSWLNSLKGDSANYVMRYTRENAN